MRWIVPCALVALAGCGKLPGGRTSTGGAYDWPARPVVVAPDVVAARIQTPPIGATPLIPGKILPPIVRGPAQVDGYLQGDAKVDVLWIVDNSGSVNNERERLARQFDRFLSALVAGRVDFHVGVTSTDLSFETGDGGRLRGPVRFIDRSTPDPRGAFRAAVDFPMSDVPLEEALAAMHLALSPPNSIGANAGFLRDEAALAVIVVSDEDDNSLGPLGFYKRFLQGIKGPGRDANISFSAVAGPVPDGCVAPGDEDIFGADAKPSPRYQELVDATTGIFASICSADFAPFMDELAAALTALRRAFGLSAPPVVSTIRVLVDGRVVPRDPINGWTWRPAERAVVFEGNFVPPPSATVEIRYDVSL